MDSGFDDFDVTLRDGRDVHIRAVRRADEEELVHAFGRLSEEARYLRFMGSVGEPNLERWRKALAGFPGSGIGIVATVTLFWTVSVTVKGVPSSTIFPSHPNQTPPTARMASPRATARPPDCTWFSKSATRFDTITRRLKQMPPKVWTTALHRL